MALFLLELVLRPLGFSARLPVGQLPRYYLKADASLSYDIQENFASVSHYVEDIDFKLWGNELGCYDRPYEGETDPVLLVGDSFAHQYGPYEHKWGTVLEQYLSRRILKCGVMGYGTRQELLKAERTIAKIGKSPSMIIVSYYATNDVRDDYLFPRYDVIDGYFVEAGSQQKVNAFMRTKWWFYDHSIIYKTVRDAIKAFRQKPVATSDAVSDEAGFFGVATKPGETFKQVWDSHLEHAKSFKHLAESNHAELFLVLIPEKQLVYDYLYTDAESEIAKKFLTSRRAVFKEFLDRENISYLDLLPGFKEYADRTRPDSIQSDRDLFWTGDIHFSIRGERLAALLVAQHIAEKNILPGMDTTEAIRKVDVDRKNLFPELY